MTIRKKIPVSERFWGKVKKTETCWIWTAAKRTHGKISYGAIWVGGRDGRHIPAHRIAYELSYGPIPDGLCVLHSCDNGLCVRPEHLSLGTHAENMKDMSLKGRAASGESHGSKTHPNNILRGEENRNSKLNSANVCLIREIRKTTSRSLQSIADQFNVSKKTILNVVHGRIWKHVK